jgi:hypothetical protein
LTTASSVDDPAGGLAGGDFMMRSVTSWRMVASLRAMCSATSATDQRSGPGLYFHCASDSPATEARNFSRVSSKYLTAWSRSFCVIASAPDEGAAAAASRESVTAKLNRCRPSRAQALAFMSPPFL